jgi:hypothetical protein
MVCIHLQDQINSLAEGAPYSNSGMISLFFEQLPLLLWSSLLVLFLCRFFPSCSLAPTTLTLSNLSCDSEHKRRRESRYESRPPSAINSSGSFSSFSLPLSTSSGGLGARFGLVYFGQDRSDLRPTAKDLTIGLATSNVGLHFLRGLAPAEDSFNGNFYCRYRCRGAIPALIAGPVAFPWTSVDIDLNSCRTNNLRRSVLAASG